MHRALRHAGGARRIKPISDLVGAGARRRRAFVLGGEQRVEPRHRGRAAADDDDLFQVRQVRRRFLNRRQQRGRHEHRLGARVLKQIAILVDGEPRIDQDRNDAGADRAPEQDWEVDGVEQNEGDAVFRFDAHAREHRADTRRGVAQFAISQIARRVDKGGLVAAAFGDVAIHEIDGGVVVAKRHLEPRPGAMEVECLPGHSRPFLDFGQVDRPIVLYSE